MKVRRTVMSKFARMIAIILTAVMLVPAWPGGSIEVEAASKTPTVFSQSDKEWADEPYGAFGATIESAGCGLLSLVNLVYYFNETEMINPKFLAQYAYDYKLKSGYLAHNLYRDFASDWGAYYGFSYIGMGSKTSDIKSSLIEGKAVIINAPNHMMSVVDYDPENNRFLLLNSASYWRKFKKSWGWITYDELDAFNRKSFYIFKPTKKTNYTITAEKVTSSKTTNNSTEFNVGISPKAFVNSINVFYGTEKASIKSINLNTKHGSTDKYNHKQLWAGKAKSMSSYSFNTAKKTTHKGWTIKFKPNTKYYYKFVVKLSNGNWYISDMNSFKTKADKPAKVTNVSVATDLGKGDKPIVSWKESSNADYYKVYIKNPSGTVVSKNEKVKGLTYEGGSLTKAGVYTAEVIASNEAGDSGKATKNFNVIDDIAVNFVYDDGITQDQTVYVKYGNSVTTPKSPLRTGYTFEGWRLDSKTIVAGNSKQNNIKSTRTYTAQWKVNSYDLRLVDGISNDLIAVKKVEYGTTVNIADFVETENVTIPKHKGYTHTDYSEENATMSQAAAHTVYIRYKWDSPYTFLTEITNIERAKSNPSVTDTDGYSIDIKVTVPGLTSGGTGGTVKGRAVVALKSDTGRLLIETESAAFVLYPKDTEVTKTINVFVPYETSTDVDLPTKAEAYVVNNYASAGIISDIAENSSKLAEANANLIWKFSESPVSLNQTLSDGKVVAVNPNLDYVEYTETVTTRRTSFWAAGDSSYELEKSEWKNVFNGTVDGYVESWPSLGNGMECGFDNKTKNGPGVALYNTYNKKPASIYTSDYRRVRQTAKTVKGYIYYHWCRNYNTGNLDHHVLPKKHVSNSNSNYKYYTFEAFYSTTVLPSAIKSGVSCFSAKNDSNLIKKSKDSYYWYRIPVYKQTWSEDIKMCTWIKKNTTPNLKAAVLPSAKTTTSSDTPDPYVVTSAVTGAKKELAKGEVGYKTDTAYTQNKSMYAYKTENTEILPDDGTINQLIDPKTQKPYVLTGNVGSGYTGKKGIVYLYKNTQVSDYTTEFIDAVTIDNDGNFRIEAPQTREPISASTGDYVLAVALEGETNAIVLGTVEAPKAEYKVTFTAAGAKEDEIWSKTVIVKDGDSAELPDADELPKRNGYHFTGWSQSAVNVRSNLLLEAQYEPDDYAVVFVDWDNQKAQIERYEYGSNLVFPELPDVPEDTEVRWKILDQTTGEVSQTAEQFLADGGMVTEDMVIAAEYRIKDIELSIISVADNSVLNALADEESVNLDSLPETEAVLEYGDVIQLEEYEEEYSDDVIFAGWKNAETKEYLETNEITESMTIYPVYYFAETVETPEADVLAGEFDSAQTVTLTCATQNAVIWYTTDGTDPETSSSVQQYTAPLTLSSTCELNFYATAMGMNNSAVASELYAINTGASGAVYHLVTIYTNIGDTDGLVYEELVRDSRRIDDSELKNVEGYTYDGLFYDEEYKEEFLADAEVVTERLVLYAKYTPKTYTVTFKDYDGSVIKTEKTAFGEPAELPETPKREGYKFVGWTPELYDCITADSEFTAKYVEEDQYATVTLPKASRSAIAGYTIKLKATVQPENLDDVVLLWESSNQDVADVDGSGNVTLIKPGTAVIRVTVESTGEYAECTITVSKNTENSIVLEKNSYLDVDSLGYLRRVAAGSNTVAELRMQFNNDGLVFYGADGQKLLDEDLVGTGAAICLEADGETLDRMLVVMTGDVNGDGKIQNKDVSMLDQCVNGMRQGEEYQMLAADVNGDGYVDTKDSVTLSRYLVGKEQI